MTDPNAKRVQDWIDHYEYLWDGQLGYHQRIEQHWRRWHADPSLVTELRQGTNTNTGLRTRSQRLRDWQTALVTPRGAINEMHRSATMANLMVETRPFLAVRGFQSEDLRNERPIESLMDHMFARLNPAVEWVGEAFRDAYVQGCAPLEFRWVDRHFEMAMPVRAIDAARFRIALDTALRIVEEARARGDASAVDPPGIAPDGSMIPAAWEPGNQQATMAAYGQWAAGVAERYGLNMPPPPFPRKGRIAKHVGIEIAVVGKLDLTWDFRVPRFRKVPRIYKRMVLDKSTLLTGCQRVNESERRFGRPAPFLLDRIAALPTGVTIRSWGTRGHFDSIGGLHQRVLEMLGADQGSRLDPALENCVEILECWEPEAGDGYRFCWIGSRQTALTGPRYFPFGFARNPFTCHYHIPFLSMGHSAFDYETERHALLDKMHSRVADLQALVAGSPLQRIGGLGIQGRSEIEPEPNKIIDDDAGEYKLVLGDKLGDSLRAAVDATQWHERYVDLSTGVGEVERGQAAQLNRVSAQEVSTRAAGQQGRPKNELHRFGAMLGNEAAPLVALQTYQFGMTEHVKNIMGGHDPLDLLAEETLEPAFQADYLVMPAVLEADEALHRQQFNEALETGLKLGVLVPGKASARMAFAESLRLNRSPIAVSLSAASEQDVAELKQEQDAVAQAQQAAQQAQQAAKEAQDQAQVLAKENTALRSFLKLPSYETVEAMMAALAAGAPQLAPGQAPEQEPQPEPGQPQLGPGPEPQEALDMGEPVGVA